MIYKNPWPPVEPIDEQKYDIELTDGTCVKNVEFWGFGGGFHPSDTPAGTSNLVDYPLKNVVSFALANAMMSRQDRADGVGTVNGLVVRFTQPAYTNEDFGPEVGSDA